MQICPICENKQTEFFHKLNDFLYYRCDNCTTLFLDPLPSIKDIKEYYIKNFVYSAGEANELNIRKRAKKILNILGEMNPQGEILLDIGSGYGFFLDEANRLGFKSTGVEPSKELFAQSIKRLDSLILNLDFDSYVQKYPNKLFDFITIIHTIEHVNNPKKMILDAFKLLKKGGVLYIETPNFDSRLFRAEAHNYTFLTPPDHLWIFSFRSFKYLLKDIKDVEVVKKTTYSQPEHFMGILKKKLEVRSKQLEAKKEQKKLTFQTSNIQPQTSNISRLKYLVFDRFLAPIFTPLLNIGGYGTILELYIRKK